MHGEKGAVNQGPHKPQSLVSLFFVLHLGGSPQLPPAPPSGNCSGLGVYLPIPEIDRRHPQLDKGFGVARG